MEKKLINLLDKPLSFYLNKFPFFDFTKNKKIIVFGAARMGKITIRNFKKNGIKIIAVCDNNSSKKGKKIEKIPIIDIKTLLTFQKSIPIVIASIHDDEIQKQLKKLGFKNIWSQAFFSSFYAEKFHIPSWSNPISEILKNKKKILKAFNLYADSYSKKTFLGIIKYRLFLDKKYINQIKSDKYREYFDSRILSLSSREVFVDGGAYDGDTIKLFIKKSKNKFNKIFAFEPDKCSFKKLKQYVSSLKDERIEIIKKGLGVKKEKNYFVEEGSLGSRVSNAGTKMIEITTLDKELFNTIPTFIKFDIEGAEMHALKGSKQLITKNIPKLAICIYHRPTDFWEIPLIIKKFVPKYVLTLRHYSDMLYDSICYAQIID